MRTEGKGLAAFEFAVSGSERVTLVHAQNDDTDDILELDSRPQEHASREQLALHGEAHRMAAWLLLHLPDTYLHAVVRALSNYEFTQGIHAAVDGGTPLRDVVERAGLQPLLHEHAWRIHAHETSQAGGRSYVVHTYRCVRSGCPSTRRLVEDCVGQCLGGVS